MTIVLIIIILVVSVILHEVAHGVVAYWNGDSTAKDQGRLTLNPIPHIDPLGTVLLPLLLVAMQAPFLFAWAKPVPFNPFYFKNRPFGIFTVGIAGPMVNILLAVFCALGVRVSGPADLFGTFFVYGAYINLFLAILNLLPIPPLDGSRAVGVLLPRDLRKAYFSLERWGMLILIGLIALGVLQKVVLPIHQWFFRALTGL